MKIRKAFAMRKHLPGSPTKNRIRLGPRAFINPGNNSAIVHIVRRPVYKQKKIKLYLSLKLNTFFIYKGSSASEIYTVYTVTLNNRHKQ